MITILQQWVRACCDEEPGAITPAHDLYGSFVAHRQAQGRPGMSYPKFNKMVRLFYRSFVKSKRRHFIKLRLLPPQIDVFSDENTKSGDT